MERGKDEKWKSDPPKSIMFIPRTNRGELATRIREGEKKLWPILKSKVKVVERGGRSLGSILVRTNPWYNKQCDRANYKLCPHSGSKPSSCRIRSVLYEKECRLCKSDGKRVVYIGETGLTGKERCNQHHGDITGKKENKSHMRVHCEETHPDLTEEQMGQCFTFRVKRRISTVFHRQIAEAVSIRMRTKD